jgi:hypothetical protein
MTLVAGRRIGSESKVHLDWTRSGALAATTP